MAFILWTPKLSVGIKRIDDQHKEFITLINQSQKFAETGKSMRFNKSLTELLDFARVHFSTEEDIFNKYKYPFAQEHNIEHFKLTEKVINFYDRAKRDENIGEEFLLFLKDWLENHLKTHDQKYAKYFKENKIKVE